MTINLEKRWVYSLAKERNVRGRRPHFSGQSAIHSIHYDKRSFFESLLLSIDLSTGIENWRFVEPHILNEPCVDSDGHIFVSSFSGTVYSFDQSGELRWESAVTKSSLWQTFLLGNDRLVVAEIAGQSKSTWCLSRETGQIIWQFENGGHSYPVALTDKAVVHASVQDGRKFGDSSVQLYALEAKSGKVIWSVHSPEYLFVPYIVDDIVFVGGRGSVRAYGLNDGELLAKFEVAADDTINRCFSSVGNQLIFSSEDSNILRSVQLIMKRGMFRKNYKFEDQWSLKLNGSPDGLVGSVSEHYFVALSNGSLAFFNPDNGGLSEIASIGGTSSTFSVRSNEVLFSKGREISLLTFT